MNPPMSDWLRTHLIQTGVIDANGVGRRAQLRQCPKCHAHILTGLDTPMWAAWLAELDPTPLSPLGEALALIEGRHTWTLNRETAKYVINDRNSSQITAWPAGTRQGEDVLAEHRCHQPIPTTWATQSQHQAAKTPSIPANSTPPF